MGALTVKKANGESINIHIRYDFPPIPIRDYDWSAVLDNYDGAPDADYHPVGHGATKELAIQDLLEQSKQKEKHE